MQAAIISGKAVFQCPICGYVEEDEEDEEGG
jgi:rubrerythrin